MNHFGEPPFGTGRREDLAGRHHKPQFVQVEVEGFRRRRRTLTYEAPASVVIGDTVVLPRFDWQDPREPDPVGRVVALGRGDWTGPCRAVLRVVESEPNAGWPPMSSDDM